jgi:hypothetical protein
MAAALSVGQVIGYERGIEHLAPALYDEAQGNVETMLRDILAMGL